MDSHLVYTLITKMTVMLVTCIIHQDYNKCKHTKKNTTAENKKAIL